MLCEIPIPDGWEFVGYQAAKPGEFVMGSKPYQVSSGTGSPMIIIRKQWQPPDFLPDGWIAMDENGDWYWFESTPRFTADQWMADGMNNFEIVRETIWQRPPVTDWKESLREIKRNQA